jgi:hypothetical protein
MYWILLPMGLAIWVSVTYKMPTHLELTNAVFIMMNRTNDGERHNIWIPDKDWVRSFWNQPGLLRAMPGQLNKAIAITVDFLNNK